MNKLFSKESPKILLNLLIWSSVVFSITSIITRDIVLSEAGFRIFVALFILRRLMETPGKQSKTVTTVLVLLLTPSLVVLNPATALLGLFVSSLILAFNELAYYGLIPGVLVIATWFTIQASLILIKSGGSTGALITLGAGGVASITSVLLYTWYRRLSEHSKTGL